MVDISQFAGCLSRGCAAESLALHIVAEGWVCHTTGPRVVPAGVHAMARNAKGRVVLSCKV
jgi:hypothetical protein